MKIFGITPDNILSSRVVNYIDPKTIDKYEDVEGEAEIKFDDVFLMHMGSEQNFRPYLQMVGHLHTFKPYSTKLKYGIDAIDFGKRRPPVMYSYHFNDDEIKSLIDKGYYNKGFCVPDIFTRSPFELPMKCNISVAAPDLSKRNDDVPIVLIVLDSYEHDIDKESSGYDDLVGYFKSATEKFEDQTYETVDTAYEDILSDIKESEIEAELEVEDERVGMFDVIPDEQEPEDDVNDAVETDETEDDIETRMYRDMQNMRNTDSAKLLGDAKLAAAPKEDAADDDILSGKDSQGEEEPDSDASGYSDDGFEDIGESDASPERKIETIQSMKERLGGNNEFRSEAENDSPDI